jgi:putative ABC transport system substrate-binding protein
MGVDALDGGKMKRREFITLLGGTVVGWPLCTRSQEAKKIPRVGVLWHARNAEEEGVYFTALQRGFRDLGYVEGQTVALEHRFPAEQYERFNTISAELVGLKVDVIIAVSWPAAVAAQRATTTIPIIFVVVPDPVGMKLVDSLGRPGGNITGVSQMATDIIGKRLEIFKEAIPRLSSVGLLLNPDAPVLARRNLEEVRAAAARLNVAVHPLEVRQPEDFEAAFAIIDRLHVDGIFTGIDPMIYNERKRIAELAQLRRLPTMVHIGEMVHDGCLITYAPNYPALYHRTATYVDKVLKGQKPGDLPVEQPTKFDLVINIKTAKALGLTIPTTLLARADEVIE